MKDLRMLIYKRNTVDMFPGLGPIGYNEVKLSDEHLTIDCFTVGCIILFGGFLFGSVFALLWLSSNFTVRLWNCHPSGESKYTLRNRV